MKFGSTFFSLYLMMILTFIGVSWVLDEYWHQELEQDIESFTGYKAVLVAVGEFLNHQPKTQWQTVLEQTSKRLNLPISLVDENSFIEFDPEQKKLLSNGQVIVYYEQDSFRLYHLLSQHSSLITLGPSKMPTRPKHKAFIRVFFLVIIALVILLWLWPLSRDLDVLQRSTLLFGKGQLNTKAPQALTPTVKPVIKTFNMMAERINHLIAEQKELTNAVSHELRTPLARTKFALQMLAKIEGGIKREKYLEQINSDVNELDGLIHEMLVYATFEHDKPALDFKPENLVDIINEQMIKHQCVSDNIEFINKVGQLSVVCDRHFIDRALNNYICNAAKYGRGKIRITLLRDKQFCTIRIEDNGAGITDEFKSVVFNAFSRGDESRSRETGGFGLGLAIVKKIMLWHQGEVSIEDSDLGGACFSLCLPLN